MVETILDEQLFTHYTGGGRSSFHPKMMLKIIHFGYSQKVYSCRGIEKLIKENIPAMWLCEDCTDCPLKAKYIKAKENRQVQWNTVFEEMKAKAKTAHEWEEKTAIYAIRRKIEVESVLGHIKGNRSFP